MEEIVKVIIERLENAGVQFVTHDEIGRNNCHCLSTDTCVKIASMGRPSKDELNKIIYGYTISERELVEALTIKKEDEEFKSRKALKKPERKSLSNPSRFKIFKRDSFTCKYCGKSPAVNQGTELQVDHIIPVSKGGTNDENNLITSCSKCNLSKSDNIL